MPLKTTEGVIGVVVVQSYESKAAYSQNDIDMFNFLADYIARAIEYRKVTTY